MSRRGDLLDVDLLGRQGALRVSNKMVLQGLSDPDRQDFRDLPDLPDQGRAAVQIDDHLGGETETGIESLIEAASAAIENRVRAPLSLAHEELDATIEGAGVMTATSSPSLAKGSCF